MALSLWVGEQGGAVKPRVTVGDRSATTASNQNCKIYCF